MEIDNIFYESAKTAIIEFLKDEFKSEFPQKFKTRFLDFFYKIGSYEEEGEKLRPNLILTNNIKEVVKAVPESYMLTLFEDEDEILFNARMKSMLAFSKHDWIVFIEIKENGYSYGICKTLNSIKEKSFIQIALNSDVLKVKSQNDELALVLLEAFSSTLVTLKRLGDKRLNINLSLTTINNHTFEEVIKEFVNASFSKLRTTQRKLKEMKIMYENIFEAAFKNIQGAICVVVDKDYEDKGFLADGIWLKHPIEFSKLFFQSKSYNEAKLLSIAELFIDMLNYDGITIVDNLGRIRAYNVFVETNLNRVKSIVGGARKRAAYTIINSRRKHIVGVYFQSQDGEVFFERVKDYRKSDTKEVAKKVAKEPAKEPAKELAKPNN
ncbi:MAG: hypothetical protein PHC46_01755 [Clostridia bacterium]|nr:hypothetical protein [Clostridia bacterium]